MPAFLPSELPIQGEVRHHWIILLRRPHPILAIALLVLVVMAAFQPWPMLVPLTIVVVLVALLRWQAWEAERIILTRTRIVRLRGVPESTTSEASLRLDRISGAIVVQTVPGKLLHYASIELEAAGSHPGFRHLRNIERPHEFYLQLRHIVFGEGPGSAPGMSGPGEPPDDFATSPLPGRAQRPLRRRR